MLTVRSTINISSQTVPPIIPVVQGDTGRAILFTLADFTIPAGATATYYVQKPSGEAVYNNATIDGNNVLVNLTAQSIIEKGDNYGQVRIAVGEDIVTSFDFILLVKEFRGIEAVQSLTEMNIFDKAVEQAADAIDDVKTDALDDMDSAKTAALDDIGDAKDAALQEIEQSTGNFADDFSASATYAAGDYVMHSGQLYRFTANHAAGAWTGSDAEAVTVGEELTDLKAETTDLKDDLSELYQISTFTKPSGGGQIYEYGISAGTTYYVTNLTNNTVNVRTCTSDGTEIENIKNGFSYNETVKFTASQNASYIRIYSGVNDTVVTFGTYGERLIELENKVDSTNTALTKANNEVLDMLGYEWDEGHFIGNTGSLGNATDRACTDFIPCKPFASITYVGENNNANVCGIAFYNKYFQYISGDINSGTLGEPVTVTSPAETAYLRMSTKFSILADSYFTYNGDKNSALMAVSQRAINPTFYVDGANGSDTTGNGMPTNPFKTIQHAINLGATKIGIFPTPVYQETINVYGGDLHLFAYTIHWGDGNNPNRVRAKLDGNNSVATILTIENANNVTLEDLEIYNCTGDGCLLNMCNNVQVVNCSFRDNGNNGIVINYTNGVFRDCVAHANGHDGFNLNYYGDTQFINCSGFNNGDDGISHHQGTTGLIDGGEWHGNTKGGVASPCYGARVDIRNVYSHDNGYGIYAFAAGASDARSFKVWNCVLTNNTNYGIAVQYNTPYIYNNKIAGNTVGQTTAYGTANFHVLD